MNYDDMPEFPPIGAYEDDGSLVHLAPMMEEASEDSPVSFSPAASPYWRINDGCDWIERDLPQRQWIVPQYLMKRKVTGLIGAPEAGKSGLALKWAISLALDLPFGDFVPLPLPGDMPRPRRVLILNAEDDEEEQQRRISSMIRETGCPISALAGNLIRVGPDKAAAKLFQPAPDNGEVCITTAFEDLRDYISKHDVDVLILDPLIELMGGLDENSNSVMGQVFAQLRGLAEECDIAVLVVHHTKKGIAVPGNLEAARGGSALGGSIRIGLTLTVMREEEAAELGVPKEKRKHYVRLDNAKQSYGPPSDAAPWFHRYSVFLDNGDSSPALEPWSPPKAVALSLEQLGPLADAIKAGFQEGIPWSPKAGTDERSVRHVLVANGINGTKAQSQAVEALKTEYGMVQAEYQTRDANGHKKDWKQGLRIGSLPKAEWRYPKNPPDAPNETGGN